MENIEKVMEERDSLQEKGMLLTQEEEASLRLLKPLFARHLDLILETLALHLKSDPALDALLSDDIDVARLKRSQREYFLSLLDRESERSVDRDAVGAADYGDPFGLGLSRQLRICVHVLNSIQPLAFEAFSWTKPNSYHTVWNALLKVVFHDLELAMSVALKQRDDVVGSARQGEGEARRALDLALNKQAAQEKERQTEHARVMMQLAIWRIKMSRLAQEMGTPLNVILGRAESLLAQTEDPTVAAALQTIVGQVERLIPLRQQLCALDHGFNSTTPTPNREAIVQGPLSDC